MQSSFNLIDMMELLKKSWRFCLSVSIVAAMVASIIILFMKPQYKSSVTLLAGNPLLSDKARLFNQQIKDLYTDFGNGDDLDRIQAFAEMNSTLENVINKNLELFVYYKSIDTNAISVIKSLRKDITYTKTEKDQLIISCELTDKILAAKIVNDIAEEVELQAQHLIQKNKQLVIQKLDSTAIALKENYGNLEKNSSSTDPAKKRLIAAEQATIINQIDQIQKTNQEYKLALATQPNFIQVMEKGVPAFEISWPNKPLIIAVAAILGFVFSALLVVNKNKSEQ
jgi:capsular polysaccharide biosynthesis protein